MTGFSSGSFSFSAPAKATASSNSSSSFSSAPAALSASYISSIYNDLHRRRPRMQAVEEAAKDLHRLESKNAPSHDSKSLFRAYRSYSLSFCYLCGRQSPIKRCFSCGDFFCSICSGLFYDSTRLFSSSYCYKCYRRTFALFKNL